MKDFGFFLGRVIAGTLVAGHGAQKLFGWFEGPGLSKWNGMTEEHLGMKPGSFWGPIGGLGEFVGGVLTALGFLNPLGPIAMGSMMIAAARKGHRGKPIWASKGGAELAVSFLATAAVIGVEGPGKYSVDSLFGIRLPKRITAVLLIGATILMAEAFRPTVTPALFGAGSKPESAPSPE